MLTLTLRDSSTPFMRFLLRDLSKVVFLDILSSWLIWTDLTSLDTAWCVSSSRDEFLRHLEMDFFSKGVAVNQNESSLRWIVSRKIRLNSVAFSNMDGLLDTQPELICTNITAIFVSNTKRSGSIREVTDLINSCPQITSLSLSQKSRYVTEKIILHTRNDLMHQLKELVIDCEARSRLQFRSSMLKVLRKSCCNLVVLNLLARDLKLSPLAEIVRNNPELRVLKLPHPSSVVDEAAFIQISKSNKWTELHIPCPGEVMVSIAQYLAVILKQCAHLTFMKCESYDSVVHYNATDMGDKQLTLMYTWTVDNEPIMTILAATHSLSIQTLCITPSGPLSRELINAVIEHNPLLEILMLHTVDLELALLSLKFNFLIEIFSRTILKGFCLAMSDGIVFVISRGELIKNGSKCVLFTIHIHREYVIEKNAKCEAILSEFIHWVKTCVNNSILYKKVDGVCVML